MSSPRDEADGAWGHRRPPALSLVFPLIEEEALGTRRASATHIAVVVGLDAEALVVCDGVVGDVAKIVATQDGFAASDLLAVLRPRLVVSAASLAGADGARLAAEAASCGAHVVRVDHRAGVDVIARLVRRAAGIAFGTTPVQAPCNELSIEHTWRDHGRE